jgi:hypothetical protein
MWTPDPTKIITAEQKSAAQRASLLAGYKAAFDAHLDAVAQQRQYDNRLTIVAYLSSTNPAWAAEAEAFIAWRDACLAKMFELLEKVEASEIQPPTIEGFIRVMPVIEWPEPS